MEVAPPSESTSSDGSRVISNFKMKKTFVGTTLGTATWMTTRVIGCDDVEIVEAKKVAAAELARRQEEDSSHECGDIYPSSQSDKLL